MSGKMNILKGDTVMIRRGKERGHRGTVKALQADHGTATVEGLNVIKRHTKQERQSGNMGGSSTGGIVEKEAPIPLSALQYVCEKCKLPTRLRHQHSASGRSVRVCARCGEPARDSAKGA
jgi:large subunit ribosomal protein L24